MRCCAKDIIPSSEQHRQFVRAQLGQARTHLLLIQRSPGRPGVALCVCVCMCVTCIRRVTYNKTDKTAYGWLVRRKGQKEVREKLWEKGVGSDGSENESNLQGTRRCENEKMCCKLCTGEKVKYKEAGKDERQEAAHGEKDSTKEVERERLALRGMSSIFASITETKF